MPVFLHQMKGHKMKPKVIAILLGQKEVFAVSRDRRYVNVFWETKASKRGRVIHDDMLETRGELQLTITEARELRDKLNILFKED